MFDSLGDRIKENYENRTRFYLPRRTYTILRLDGKSFHTWTRGLKRPYDETFMGLMDQVTARLCKEIMGSVFGYVQSDEISLHLVDFDPDKDKLGREAWFDGNLQKMVSVSASLATAFFNELALDQMPEHLKKRGFANFDSRVFTINDPIEVYNYFVWRQNDATRNSILGAARSYFSDKECFGKSCKELLDMLLQKGCNWNDYPSRFKRGGFIYYNEDVTMGKAINKKTGEEITYQKPIGWDILEEVPIFTREEGRKWLWGLIPKMPVFDFETTVEDIRLGYGSFPVRK